MGIPRVLNRKNRILLAELTKTDFKFAIKALFWAISGPFFARS